MSRDAPPPSMLKRIGFWLGPAIAIGCMLAGAPEGLSFAAWGTAGLLIWMAIWWATEPVPIPVTSLLPLIILPLIGAGSPNAVGAAYGHHIVLLLLGGFVLALAIERWDLHKRLALMIVSRTGSSPRALIAGFMLATALLSMWISNTATTLMMVPIALSAGTVLQDRKSAFIPALLLGICYAASIGGAATPIGTPTNLIALDWLNRETGVSLGFAEWMAFGLPAVGLLVPAAWWIVTRSLPAHGDTGDVKDTLQEARKSLGPLRGAERRVLFLFILIAGLWVSRLWSVAFLETLGWSTLSTYSGAQVDMMIAILGAVLVCLIPAGGEGRRPLLTWSEATKLPWGVLLLFGGGIALGNAVRQTGLSAWLGASLSMLSALPAIIFILAVVALVIFLTELTSNVATMTTLAPILGALSVAVGVAPSSLLAPAAVAASCAFMLPVATAPNAIVYATDQVSVQSMMQRGLRLNLIAILVIGLIGYTLAPLIL